MPLLIQATDDGLATMALQRIIQLIGDDPRRPGLLDTPDRVIRSWKELYAGYRMKVEDLFKTFDEPCDQMVIIKNVEFWSMCEHHMLPFFGVADIGYLPDGKVIGASKLPRILEVFARRLQIQERLTTETAEAIQIGLKPKGVGVVIEAKHLCMVCRGVQKQQSTMVTSKLLGAIKDDPQTRAEFLQFIKR